MRCQGTDCFILSRWSVDTLFFFERTVMYRIMYELAVCSDGMTEAAQPRSFRQNRPASEYII